MSGGPNVEDNAIWIIQKCWRKLHGQSVFNNPVTTQSLSDGSQKQRVQISQQKDTVVREVDLLVVLVVELQAVQTDVVRISPGS